MDKALRYAQRGQRSVHGWLTRYAAETIVSLAAVQEQRSIRGGAVEIGVHEGRLFVLLALLLRPDERALAIDLFDEQAENVDASGYGSKDRLARNLERHGVGLDRVEILAENSMRLTRDRVFQSVREPRLFSVDGGHTAEITHNDLSVAAACVCDGGIVILDDYLSPAWPGVTEGAVAFMRETDRLTPVAFGGNKLILCRGDAVAYRRAVSGVAVEMFGAPCMVHRSETLRERLAGLGVWRAIRSTAVGRLIKRVV